MLAELRSPSESCRRFGIGCDRDTQSARTETVYNDLNPVWNEELEFTGITRFGASGFSLSVWDEDTLDFDDILGRIDLDRFDLNDIVQGVPTHFELPIQSDLCTSNSPTIFFTLTHKNLKGKG